jgi:3-phosphoshikimate 1-carboxyvinyltransferase
MNQALPAAGAWPEALTIAPFTRACGSVRLPGSKSMSNRALLLAALARGETALEGLLDADDTRRMLESLHALGVSVQGQDDGPDRLVRVAGCGGEFPVREADLFLGNAGTAMRPLAAALAFSGGTYRLDGVARMRERPIGDLAEALNALGADVRYLMNEGFPPLHIGSVRPPSRDRVTVRGTVSSQFLSGLLMAAPLFAPAGGVRIEVAGELISRPYVAMTVAMMREFGARVREAPASGGGGSAFHVEAQPYAAPGRYAIEGDASGASYFLALGAIAGGPVRVLGAGSRSLQGDVAFAHELRRMGAGITMGPDWIEAAAGEGLRGITVDASAIPDAAMTLAVLALFARGPTRILGIASWRVKETDRIEAMAAELAKVGARVASGPDWIEIEAPAKFREARIQTYDDHRMAMCLSLAAGGGVPMHIQDPGCVAKTFPGFFRDLARLAA